MDKEHDLAKMIEEFSFVQENESSPPSIPIAPANCPSYPGKAEVVAMAAPCPGRQQPSGLSKDKVLEVESRPKLCLAAKWLLETEGSMLRARAQAARYTASVTR